MAFILKKDTMSKITPVQAGKAITAGAKVHTFIRSLGWMGADMKRSVILSAIRAHGGADISEDAAHMDHALMVPINGRNTYIETDPKEMLAIQKEPMSIPAKKCVYTVKSGEAETIAGWECRAMELKLKVSSSHPQRFGEVDYLVKDQQGNYVKFVQNPTRGRKLDATLCKPYQMEILQKLQTCGVIAPAF